jgi:uncharacterized membrane protein YfcA
MGFIAGFLSGLLGVGGGWLVTPALNFLGFPMAQAIGTGIAQILGTSLFGVIRHYRNGHADLKLGTIVGLAMISSVEIGKQLLQVFARQGNADIVIHSLYVILLGSLGSFMMTESLGAGKRAAKHKRQGTSEQKHAPLELTKIGAKTFIPSAERPISWLFLLLVGMLTGFLSGLLGVGGGFILVPIFIYVIRINTIAAVATSLVCVFFSSCYGTVSFAASQLVDFKTAGVLLAGSIGGSYFGVWAAKFAEEQRIKVLFSLLLIVSAASMILAALGYEQLGKIVVFSMASGTTIIMIFGVVKRAMGPLESKER